jgi:hypothetical protein
MSSDDEKLRSKKLRLNTLHRFAKHSDRLVLMEYSHCEVPAGCGGYVMRWHDPRAGRPLVLNVACPTEVQGFLDGEPITASRVTLPAGDHLFAVHATLKNTPAPLIVAVFIDDPETFSYEAEVVLFSAGDGTWRCTAHPPADSWNEPGFDDSGWHALAGWTPTREELGEDYWRYESLLNRGAEALRLESREVWIRKRIVIPEESAS